MAQTPSRPGLNYRYFHWNEALLAQATDLPIKDLRAYFTDGRRASFLIERRLARRLGWRLADSERDPYDLLDNGAPAGKWEVRCVTSRGVNFSPSRDQGSGRTFTELSFMEKLRQLKGFILADIVVFPRVTFYFFPVETVLGWYKDGKLNANAFLPYARFSSLLAADADDPRKYGQ
jgi:hypothetical protein